MMDDFSSKVLLKTQLLFVQQEYQSGYRGYIYSEIEVLIGSYVHPQNITVQGVALSCFSRVSKVLLYVLQAGIEWSSIDSQLQVQKTVHKMYSTLVKILANESDSKDSLVAVLMFALSAKYRYVLILHPRFLLVRLKFVILV